MTTQRPVIIVMVKAPVPGTVKTRLGLPPESAAHLAMAFAQDVVGSVLQTGAAVRIAFAPADGRALLEPSLPGGLTWREQQGDDLGGRMDYAMADAQAEGFGPLVVIGTDSPTLPASYLLRAISALQSAETEVVLGPTEDGGYYLVGAGRHVPGLFDNVAWSTAQAFADTADNAARRGLRCLALPPWYDIDTPDDMSRLRREITANAALGRRVPATAAWLQRKSAPPPQHIDGGSRKG